MQGLTLVLIASCMSDRSDDQHFIVAPQEFVCDTLDLNNVCWTVTAAEKAEAKIDPGRANISTYSS